MPILETVEDANATMEALSKKYPNKSPEEFPDKADREAFRDALRILEQLKGNPSDHAPPLV